MNMEKWLNKIIQGDCLEIMKELPDKSVDLIVTDPPYGVEYEGGHFHSGKVSIKRKREKLENDDRNVYQYILPELYRVLKEGSGGAYVFYAAGYEPFVFPPNPFEKYQVLIWHKSNATFGALNARYKYNYEPFLWLQKPPSKWRGGSKEKSLWTMRREPQNIFHPTQKPKELIMKMILNSSDEGDIILDPFLGSGTTAVAAQQLKRNFIGIEISEKYCEIARQRLGQKSLL